MPSHCQDSLWHIMLSVTSALFSQVKMSAVKAALFFASVSDYDDYNPFSMRHVHCISLNVLICPWLHKGGVSE